MKETAICLAFVTWGLLPGCGQPARTAVKTTTAPAQAKSFPAPEELPEGVREAVRQLMFEHADEIDGLTWSSLTLDYGGIVLHAQAMADRRHRPDSKLANNPNIPATYMALADAMDNAALELVSAAEKKDQDGVAKRFGELMTTCVNCHSAYLVPADGVPTIGE